MSYWFPYLKRELIKQGFDVLVPRLPDPDIPILEKWLPVALRQGIYDKDTVIVGHSAGGPLLLSILEHIDVQIAKTILVAGYGRQRPGKKEKDTMIQQQYDWKKIRANTKGLYFINAVNDPWGCNDIEGRYMFDRLGGVLIINNDGHMGSDSFNQPYREFPLLLKLIV